MHFRQRSPWNGFLKRAGILHDSTTFGSTSRHRASSQQKNSSFTPKCEMGRPMNGSGR